MAGEHAPTPVPPHEAATKLRLLIKEVRARVNSIGTKSPTGDAHAYWSAASERRDQLENGLALLDTVISTRRVTQIRNQLTSVRMLIDRERNYRVEAYGYATKQTGGLGPSSLQALQNEVGQINDLIQSLPTSSDLPVGNMQNMLRAIMAILRTGGFPGAGNLNWEEVIKNAQKENSNGAGEAAAAAELTPSSVVKPAAPTSSVFGNAGSFST